MSREVGGGGLSLLAKVLGVIIVILGGLIIYYSYKTTISIIDPMVIVPLGVFLIAVGGFMLLARVTS